MELAAQTLFLARCDDARWLRSTKAKHTQKMRTPKQVHNILQKLFEMRRVYKSKDAEPITDRRTCCEVHDHWQNKFIAEDLGPEQRQKSTRDKILAFAAMLKNTYGSTHLVMAIIQSGMNCAAHAGASEHGSLGSGACPSNTNAVARLSEWTLKVAKAIDEHKKDPMVQEQRRQLVWKKCENSPTN